MASKTTKRSARNGTRKFLDAGELRNVETKLARRSLRHDEQVTLHVWEVEALVAEARSGRRAFAHSMKRKPRG